MFIISLIFFDGINVWSLIVWNTEKKDLKKFSRIKNLKNYFGLNNFKKLDAVIYEELKEKSPDFIITSFDPQNNKNKFSKINDRRFKSTLGGTRDAYNSKVIKLK